MRILITNDDGFFAPGIAALHAALRGEGHEVFVSAPETERSAVGHAITLMDPIRVYPLPRSTGMTGYAVSGTPADCVKLALSELMEQPPDIVISGINQGANVGVNVLYSGTVSAATEASILGRSSLAVSLDSHKDKDFSYAARVAAAMAAMLPDLEQGTCLNVNVPALPPDQVRGIRLTRQSTARLHERFLRRTDPRGHVYFWQSGETMGTEGDLETDYPALLAGYVTVTPVHHDLTHARGLEKWGLEARLPELP